MQPDIRRSIDGWLRLMMGLLTLAGLVFTLALSVSLGSELARAFAPKDVRAMPERTATPIAMPEATEPAAPVPTGTPPTVESPGVVMPTAPVTPTAVPTTPTPSPTPTAAPATPVLIAGADGANVRIGPSTYHEKIAYLAPDATALVLGRYSDWYQIDIEGGLGWVYAGIVVAQDVDTVPVVSDFPAAEADHSPEVIAPPAAPAQINEMRWIDVDISEQTLRAYEDGVVVKTYLVSTGLPATPTPTGQFRIWIKLRFDDMAGVDYYIEDVPHVMYFYQGYGLHGVTWHANFGHRMSHGCVNQPNDMAAWLFDFAGVGTLVNIHE